MRDENVLVSVMLNDESPAIKKTGLTKKMATFPCYCLRNNLNGKAAPNADNSSKREPGRGTGAMEE